MVTLRVAAEQGFAQVSLTRSRTTRELDAYDFLIEAICKQAARDIKGKSLYYKIDAMDFFRSWWFEYMTDLDGEEILQQLLAQ